MWLARRILLGLTLLGSGCAAVTTPDAPQAALDRFVLPIVEIPQNLAKTLQRPSNSRRWSRDQAVLARAEFHGDSVTVRNIRNFSYQGRERFSIDYYDKTYRLDDLESFDFIVVPFNETPDLAHVAVSFGFRDGQQLAVSVEIRKEEDETFDPLKGLLRQYELMYVVLDERDFVRLRTDHYLCGVYVYRTNLSPEDVRRVFVDVMRRVNKLADEPEYYNTLTNNCTTNVVEHVNQLENVHIPYTHYILLPGHLGHGLYDLGLLDTDVSFAETKSRARVNRRAYQFADAPDFSARIRQ